MLSFEARSLTLHHDLERFDANLQRGSYSLGPKDGRKRQSDTGLQSAALLRLTSQFAPTFSLTYHLRSFFPARGFSIPTATLSKSQVGNVHKAHSCKL